MNSELLECPNRSLWNIQFDFNEANKCSLWYPQVVKHTSTICFSKMSERRRRMPRTEHGKCTTTSRAIQLKSPSPKNYMILCVFTMGRMGIPVSENQRTKNKMSIMPTSYFIVTSIVCSLLFFVNYIFSVFYWVFCHVIKKNLSGKKRNVSAFHTCEIFIIKILTYESHKHKWELYSAADNHCKLLIVCVCVCLSIRWLNYLYCFRLKRVLNSIPHWISNLSIYKIDQIQFNSIQSNFIR